jgi:putative endonuclease
MAYHVYVILCNDGSFYTGYTRDLDSRIRLHKNGRGARYTRMHKPKKLVYAEEFGSRREAMNREKKIKKLSHHQKLELVRTSNKRSETRSRKRSSPHNTI